ncbi:MAG: hypothetical protein JWL77_5888 [Chthonomonadaceae bacterium]|nr:hypothetical protein [Chthonomonadaceae bacterium]
MRVFTVVGLFLVAHLLAPAAPVLAAPQSKHAPTKKLVADTLAKEIVGTWKADVPTGNGGEPVHMQVTFKKDGTATQHIEGSGPEYPSH